MLFKKHILFPSLLIIFIIFSSCSPDKNKVHQKKIRGWNILSSHFDNNLEVIRAAKDYEINHLELSHHIIMDLRHARTDWRRNLAKDLMDSAHKEGIEDVFVWDHALYPINYYPKRFLVDSSEDKRINLDNPAFWMWFKEDYRDMFAQLPDVDGIVLTFIETGAKINKQYSAKLNNHQKLAMVVDSIASIVIDELGKKMHIRTFVHDQWDKEVILGALSYMNHPGLKIMVKETPHDFFNYHPVQDYVEKLPYPVVIEFDAAHEYNGQGIVANTFTKLILERWKYYQELDNVIGYVARTDRYGTTKIINRPSEVLLHALKRATENPEISENEVCNEFIAEKYGKESIPYIKPAFKKAIDINNSSFYSLGTNTTNHSALDVDYISSYSRYLAGRWNDPPTVFIEHNVNKEFHYFKDIAEHLSPKKYKKVGGRFYGENPEVFDSGWVSYEEKLDTNYLNDLLIEKDYAVNEATKALDLISKAEKHVKDKDAYKDLYETFNRTLIIAKLHRASHKVYFGYRMYVQDTLGYAEKIVPIISEGMNELRASIEEIENYPHEVPAGQWYWHESKADYGTRMKDTKRAKRYLKYITETGWPGISDITITDL